MKRSLALSLFAALVIAVGSYGAVAAQEPSQHFDVRIWNDITHAYPFTATMELRYRADGVVRGFYHPAGLPSFVPIVGGRTGDSIWLNIGTSDRWTFNGRFRDGKIVGSARRSGRVTPYSFVATPQ
ncbi:MAG: hypothetical protein ACREMP_06485 [Candidatus Tyrphobacter sp.]